MFSRPYRPKNNRRNVDVMSDARKFAIKPSYGGRDFKPKEGFLKKKINCQWFYLEEILREVLIRIMVGFVTNKTCVCYNTIKKVREGSQGVVSWEIPSNWFPFTIVLIYWIHHGFQKCFHWILCEKGTRSSKTWSKVAWMCFILMVWDNVAKNLWARGSLVASNLRKQSCSNSACSAARMFALKFALWSKLSTRRNALRPWNFSWKVKQAPRIHTKENTFGLQ